MEENMEIMTNDEEVIEAVSDAIAEGGKSGCASKALLGFGLGIVAGVVICKVVKPAWTKFKARKNKFVEVVVEDDEKETSDNNEEKDSSKEEDSSKE